MKTIYLLRHAQALSAGSGGGDFERKLSPKGLEDALALGHTLKKQDHVPSLILCSAAHRTKSTCERLLAGLEQDIPTRDMKEIYSAGGGELFALLQSVDDDVSSAMIIGHNPIIYELAVKLSAQGADHLFSKLAQGYAPASLSIIESNIEHWADLNPNRCTLKMLMNPMDYNAPERPTRWM